MGAHAGRIRQRVPLCLCGSVADQPAAGRGRARRHSAHRRRRQLSGQGPEGLGRPERLHLDRFRRPHDQGWRKGQMGRTQHTPARQFQPALYL